MLFSRCNRIILPLCDSRARHSEGLRYLKGSNNPIIAVLQSLLSLAVTLWLLWCSAPFSTLIPEDSHLFKESSPDILASTETLYSASPHTREYFISLHTIDYAHLSEGKSASCKIESFKKRLLYCFSTVILKLLTSCVVSSFTSVVKIMHLNKSPQQWAFLRMRVQF